MFSLVDCNNFYVSCERLFRPDLSNAPIIVLSNNDGCVISRSNEAKALGIKMGVPYFEVKAMCKTHKVHVFSSNYSLYRDLSERVISVIKESWDATEVYSIDEVFLNLRTLPKEQHDPFCWELRRKILQNTGIPTSIGVGETKTLAKVANYIAKKKLAVPVFNLQGEMTKSKWLSRIEVGDIWGVGRQWQKKLNALNIYTANELRQLNAAFIKKRFNVVLLKTALELNGIVCLDLEAVAPKQSIMSSCSFGELPSDYQEIKEAISHHCATAWAKLRKQGLLCQHLSIFVRSNPFHAQSKQYANSIGFRLINPTDDLRVLTKMAVFCLEKIYQAGIRYHKSGVLLADLIDKKYQQHDLFHQPQKEQLLHSENLMRLIDYINQKHGPRTVRLAAEGFTKEWSMKRQKKSPNYTTQWHELPIVYAR